MTREPDRFDKQARELYGTLMDCQNGRVDHATCRNDGRDHITAYLRATESSALERLAAEIAQVKNGNIQAGPNRKTHVGLIHGIEIAEAVVHRHVLAARRAMIPPAAAPAIPDTCPEEGCVLEENHDGPCDTNMPEPEAAPAAEPRLDNLAAESPAHVAETGKAPTPSLRKECGDNSPEWWTGRWRDWHRGHGCGKDDGQPCTPEGVAEFAAHGRLPGRAAPPEGEGK